MLSQTEGVILKIWKEVSESIKQIFDMVEQENKSCLNFIIENDKLTELSYSDLEKLVQIVEGNTLNDWIAKKNSYLRQLEKTKNWFDIEVKAFSEKLKEQMKETMQLIKGQPVYKREEDLYQILAGVKGIDESIFSLIIEIVRNKKISDCVGFLQKEENQINKMKIITNVIRNLSEHCFNTIDYFSETFRKSREDLINKISKEQKNIVKFLVLLQMKNSSNVDQMHLIYQQE